MRILVIILVNRFTDLRFLLQRLQKVVNKIRMEEDGIRRNNHDRKVKLDQVKRGKLSDQVVREVNCLIK